MVIDILNIACNIMVMLLVFQLTTIMHEVGHAIPAIIFSKDIVNISLGVDRGNTIKSLVIGKLTISLRTLNPFIGIVTWSDINISKNQKALITIGGPILSLVISIILFALTKKIQSELLKSILTFSAFCNFIQFIMTIIPIKYPKYYGAYAGHLSDGSKLISLLKN
ncbi:MAG: hypothetical protein RSA29_14835 [Clostridium sp.]|uniref:hypothetical protein n=1 Tax=Clostridium sp. TaxID=1506 RepID=UPI003217A86E